MVSVVSTPRSRSAARGTATLAVLVFVATCALPNVGAFDGGSGGDIPLYRTYGTQMLDGRIPYRDFFVEYPPGALPVFALPAVAGEDDYAMAFKLVMVGLGALLVVCVVLALESLGVGDTRLLAGAAVAALAPLALGSGIVTHYDLWPAALTAAALAATLRGRPRLGFVALGLAAAAKLYPLVLLPLATIYVLRRSGARAAVSSLAAAGAALAVVALPFVALGAGGVRFGLEFEARRPLHVESLGGSVLLAADRAGVYAADVVSSFNSHNLDDRIADAVAPGSVVVAALAVLAVWILFARGPAGDMAFVAAAAAAIAAVVVFGKVLSPQFVVWLVPVVALVARARCAVLLLAALALTQVLALWDGVGLNGAGWVVLARNLVLLALFVLLVRPVARAARRAAFAS